MSQSFWFQLGCPTPGCGGGEGVESCLGLSGRALPAAPAQLALGLWVGWCSQRRAWGLDKGAGLPTLAGTAGGVAPRQPEPPTLTPRLPQPLAQVTSFVQVFVHSGSTQSRRTLMNFFPALGIKPRASPRRATGPTRSPFFFFSVNVPPDPAQDCDLHRSVCFNS